MATLTRPKQLTRPVSTPTLACEIPTPFPRDQLVHTQEAEETSRQPIEVPSGSSRTIETQQTRDSVGYGLLQEVLPSIVNVQKPCLVTLNTLLSSPTGWSPIVPDRRHSLPASQTANTSHPLAESSSALQTLVTNLRNRNLDDDHAMIEIAESPSDADLLHELGARIQSISSSLDQADVALANSIVSLLSHLHRLSEIHSSSTQSLNTTAQLSQNGVAGPSDPFTLLKHQLYELQVERLSTPKQLLAPGAPPTLVVEAALLWNKIDEELETVVALCKERTEHLPKFSLDSLPPQYDQDDYRFDSPPDYHESSARTSIDLKTLNSTHSPVSASRQMDEKMRLDLESITLAIDRLYLVAPQLHNQRVELKSSKLAQLEKASRDGTPQSRSAKQKENDVHDLERLLDLLGKASERTMANQSVVLDGGLPTILEKARQKDIIKKQAFVEHLANHSDARRLHDQDAVLQPRTKDPHALLTLPEFIREAVPASSVRADPKALLTLPEFVKESPPGRAEDIDSEIPGFNRKKNSLRHRSLSAPPLSWLRSSSKSGSGTNSSTSAAHSRSRSRGINALSSGPSFDFQVSYVAENHENLQHVLVFFTVMGATPGVDIQAEVLPPFPENADEGGDRLIISSGTRQSSPLPLPVRILPGKQAIKVQSGHYEIKLTTIGPRPSAEENEDTPLLDATQLSAAKPTSFICGSCSLMIVQSSRIGEFRDLPSEHWQELVDAWMCHSDQKVHEEVIKHSKGRFWPKSDQALIGGSYILFDESSMALHNLHLTEEFKPGEDWRLVRCLCGAVLGRYQSHLESSGSARKVFRLLKFAIRPVSLNIEPLKIPLSAFIVEEMMEFVRAHATFRFVILDEEEELPRMLIWLFKPSIQLAYSTPTEFAIPKTASIRAAKILFKILAPSERTTDLKTILAKYPGFPQAEYLFYPMPVCRRLAGMLKQSNKAYPENMRVMTGLELGWLHRA